MKRNEEDNAQVMMGVRVLDIVPNSQRRTHLYVVSIVASRNFLTDRVPNPGGV